MKTIGICLLFIMGLVLPANPALAQMPPQNKPGTIVCTECHTCPTPTTRVPCLKNCPRTTMVHQTSPHNLQEAPETVMLGDLVDLYQAVRFDHKAHASMAGMGNDCATCHHYSPPGKIPACEECHSIAPTSNDLRKPNLKGAYHRQCLSCHAEWSHETRCIVCHIPSDNRALGDAPPDPTDIMGKSHPVILQPTRQVYTTPYKGGPIVTFHHNEHVELFGLTCVNCHRKENCSNCHDIKSSAVKIRTQEEVHAICNDCHLKDACSKCHDHRERPAFTHDRTGWPLTKYHQGLDCRACHPTGKRIAEINAKCQNCHKGWNNQNFRHAVTGLMLDATHSEMECTDCHIDRMFDQAPSCAACHEDNRNPKEYPPGEFIGQR